MCDRCIIVDFFMKDQYFVVFETADSGTDLESCEVNLECEISNYQRIGLLLYKSRRLREKFAKSNTLDMLSLAKLIIIIGYSSLQLFNAS